MVITSLWEVTVDIVTAIYEGLLGLIEGLDFSWVAVKELKISYYIGETLLFTIYAHYGNLI